MIDRSSGDFWRGGWPDVVSYLREATADTASAEVVRQASCTCGSATFRVFADDEEGAAVGDCSQCSERYYFADSRDLLEDAELDDIACSCGQSTWEAGTGFALREDGDARWVYVGLRCTGCGTLGIAAEWKIDWGPSAHLAERA